MGVGSSKAGAVQTPAGPSGRGPPSRWSPAGASPASPPFSPLGRSPEGWRRLRESHDAAAAPVMDVAVDMVAPGLFIGNVRGAKRSKRLQTEGITHVLNCSPMVPCFHRDKFHYLELEVYDDSDEDISQHFEAAIAFVREGRAAGGVFVHCFAGTSRSAALVAAYLVRDEGMGLEDALATVRRARASVRPNAGFMEQLDRWAREQGRAGWGGGVEEDTGGPLPPGEGEPVFQIEDVGGDEGEGAGGVPRGPPPGQAAGAGTGKAAPLLAEPRPGAAPGEPTSSGGA